MNNIFKLFTSIAFLFVITITHAETRIIYLNGIDGSVDKSILSQEKIRVILKNSGYETKFSNVKYEFFYNPSDGFVDDKIELRNQAILSGAALTNAKNIDVTATAQSALYIQKLGYVYKSPIDSGDADSEDVRHIYSVVRDFSKYLSTLILKRDIQIIVVSHSQGNFFSEAVNAYLSVSKTATEFDKISKNLRFVGVASVAASTPNNKYISAANDVALAAHQESTLDVPNFTLLPRNIRYCNTEDAVCVNYAFWFIDKVFHGFLEVYTADLIDKISNLPFYQILSNLIKDSFDELVANRQINISSHPLSQTQNLGSTATFNVVATGTDLIYQWQVSFDSAVTWANVTTGTGATTSSYTTPTISIGMDGFLYRVVITNSAGGYSSSAIARLTVTSEITPPVATGLLPDTGITSSQCYAAGSDTLVSCTSAAAIALSPTQDGMIGRDVTSPSNTDGKLGFSYSTVPNPVGGSYPITDCVKDNITGLIWEGKPISGVRAAGNLYTNYGNNSVNDTSAFIAAVNASNLCGANDWRLPTAKELQSIVDYGTSFPSIDLNWFPNTQSQPYWTSNNHLITLTYGWAVDFRDGRIGDGGKELLDSVRLVRGPSTATPSYTYSADGSEVTDDTTGLIWKRCPAGMNWNGSTCTGAIGYYNLEQSLAYAKNNSSINKSWRLPNIKELFSLCQLGVLANPCIDSVAFPLTPTAGAFITSTPYYIIYYILDVGFQTSLTVNYGDRGNGGLLRLVR